MTTSAIMSPTLQLVDVNVWIAMAIEDHEAHHAAVRWATNAAPESAVFCRVTQLVVLRLLTNSRILKQNACGMREAWDVYDRMCAAPFVRGLMSEPANLTGQLKTLTNRNSPSTKLWTDAYLAAFAIQGDLILVTFDKAFRQFADLRSSILSA